jgi:dissimilatory sulfite reductase related protein
MTDAVPSAQKKLRPVVRTFGQRDVLFDNEGFFNDFSDWEEDIAGVLSKESGIATLTDAHWQVIHFLRKFYAGHGRAPLNSQLKKGTGMTLMELEGLFPGGIKNGARLLAGLPNPKTCT